MPSSPRNDTEAAVAGAGIGFRHRGVDRPALEEVELEARAGEVLGILGPNGSGKTTLIRVLSTTVRPQRGALRYFPQRPSRSLAALRRRIAVAFDRVPLLEALSGAEHAVRITRLRGWEAADASRRAQEWLELFGLGGRIGDRCGTYSFGMRRKLALAEAFAAGGELLLLDEPLVGLDASGRDSLSSALAGSAEAGTAAVVTTHDGSFATHACARVLFLDRGKVIGVGAPSRLIADLALATTFEIEVEAARPFQPIAPPGDVESLGASASALRFASRLGTEVLPALTAAVVGAGATIRRITVREPDLEDVFVSLTGRSLRTNADRLPETIGSMAEQPTDAG